MGDPTITTPTTDIAGSNRPAVPFDMGAYIAVQAAPQAFKIGTVTYATLQDAITALNNAAGEIEQLLDFTEETLTMIPSNVTLIIPTGLTLTFDNNISNAGTISNNGTLEIGGD